MKKDKMQPELFPETEMLPPPRITDETIWVVGVSGGKDSSAVLLWMIHESGIPKNRILATFADTGNEHQWTYDHIDLIHKTVHPIIRLEPKKAFFDLALHKRRFPSARARFCTEELKIHPAEAHIKKLIGQGRKPISVSGVRADESEERSRLSEYDYAGQSVTYIQWRPLLTWKLDDVLSIHERYNLPLNPLYAIGATRVGCWPCIMSRKAEIRRIATMFPERIDEIRRAEEEAFRINGRPSTFFSRDKVPPRFRSKEYYDKGKPVMEPVYGKDAQGNRIQVGEQIMKIATIDDVVRWAMTGDRAKGHYSADPEEEPSGISCHSGFCE